MARVHFRLHTDLEPASVLAALTDFGPSRADTWPNVDIAHLEVHDSGPGWADVTEGSSVAGGVWERLRYDWAEVDRLSAVTVESNTWAPGSRWDYRLAPADGGGTDVEVRVLRTGRGARGRLLGAFIAVFGARRLRGDMKRALARTAARRAG
ncbi:MAG TPA: SRPBCC family protein [Terriglobales bacterium]|nr:SRPBCC family protein [Terriglobales bacterium]